MKLAVLAFAPILVAVVAIGCVRLSPLKNAPPVVAASKEKTLEENV